MKICMITPYPPQTGGVPVHAEALAEKLSKKHEIFIITYGRLGRKGSKNIKIEEVPVPGIKFFRGASFFIGALMKLRSLTKKNRIDIIHAHYMHPPGTAAAIFRKLSKKSPKLVTTAHGSDLMSLAGGRISGKLVRWAGRSCDRLICVSRHLAEAARREGTPRKRIEVVYNGLDQKEMPGASVSSLRKEFHLPSKKKLILFAGSLNEAKGADIFAILALQLLGKKKLRESLHFVLVGDGPEKKWLEDFCRDNEISGHVTLTGRKKHEETLKYIRCSDILVVPSRIEGFGLTALEGMKMGVPLISTGAGALGEFLPDICIRDNIPSAVMNLLYDKKLRHRMITLNKKIASRFTLERMADETEKIYARTKNS